MFAAVILSKFRYLKCLFLVIMLENAKVLTLTCSFAQWNDN